MAIPKSTIRLGIPAYWASINMRAGLTVVSPIIVLIGSDLGLSTIQLAWLTSIPVICFAFSSPATTWIRRFGSLEQVIAWALWILGISLTLRALHGAFSLYLFTIGVGVGIAILNVSLPIWVKQTSQEHSGLLTGIYVSMMSVSTSVAIVLAPKLASLTSLSWRLALLPWGAVAIVSAIWWQIRTRKIKSPIKITKSEINFKMFLHSPLAWQVMLVFGIQSMNAYAARAWVPAIMISKGYSMQDAGTVIASAGLVGAILAFYIPHFAQRQKDQRLTIWVIGVIGMFAYLALAYGNHIAVGFGAAISNIVQWLTYPLALLLIILRSENPNHAQSLSAMVQTFGYLLGAAAPLLTGFFFDVTGTWNLTIWFMALTSLAIGIAGHFAGRIGHVKKREVIIDSVA